MKRDKRDLKVIMTKGGSGSISPKLSLPKHWIDEIGVTEIDRTIEATLEGDVITIRKKKANG